MKKFVIILLVSIISLSVIFNLKVNTKQCIDFQCNNIKIPLYLKILNFLGRHYNYEQLVRLVTVGCGNDEERAIKILAWTYSNIRKPPKSFPIIDDHAWHIIIRGYGTEDQSQDVFTTLCNYAKIDAYFSKVKDSRFLSLAKINNSWTVIDAYAGVYFVNREGRIAGIGDLLSGNYQLISISREDITAEGYAGYFSSLTSIDDQSWKFLRAAIQSPIRRFIYWVKTKH